MAKAKDTQKDSSQEETKTELPRKDLSRLIPGVNWPTNRVVRSIAHVNVSDLELLSNQSADFIPLPESFVFEGLDVLPIKPLRDKVALQVELDDGRVLGAFELDGETMTRLPTAERAVTESALVKYGRIVLRNLGDEITSGDSDAKGRLAFVFKGYTLEHWR